MSTRTAHGRIVLALEHVHKGFDEAKAAVEMLRRIVPHTPAARAVVWDMILRGAHFNVILTELGLVPIVGVHAKEIKDKTKGRKPGSFVPKTVDLEDRTIELPDGSTRTVHLAAHNGCLSIKEFTETGEPHYEHLVFTRVQRHKGKRWFRWYGYATLPEEYGGVEIAVRLHQSEEDDRRKINRTENLRAIPEGSEAYERLHRRLRNDAESLNRGIRDTLFLARASAKGWRRQLIDLYGHARMVNAVTVARCRARAPVPGAA